MMWKRYATIPIVLGVLVLVLQHKTPSNKAQEKPAARAATVFSGRITDSDLRGLEGAQIEALWLDAFDEPLPLAEAQSSADGSYRLAVELPATRESAASADGALLLRASHTGYASGGRRVEARESHESHESRDSKEDFVLSTLRAEVCVRVIDAHEDPVAGARVQLAFEAFAGEPDRLLWLEGATASDGLRCFAEVPAVRGTIHYAAFARALGRAEGEQDRSSGGARTEITVKLGGGIELAGIVRRADGARVPGAQLALTQIEGGWGERAIADGEGRVLLENAPLGAAITIAVEGGEVLASGDEQQAIALPKSGDRFAFEVVVEPAGQIAGVVRSSAGDPVAGAELELAPNGPADGTPRQTQSDRDGRFVFRGLRKGTRAMISARAEGLAPSFHRDVVASAELSVVLSRGGAIEGRVIDRRGLGVADVEVYAHRVARAEKSERGLEEYKQQSTGDHGEYRFEHMNAGEYRVEVRPRARMQWSTSASNVFHVDVVEEQVARVDDAVIDRGATLIAEVAGADGEPARHLNAEVELLPAGRGGAPHRATVQCGADGRFTLSGLEPGSISLALHAHDRGWSTPETAELADGETTTISVVLAGALELAGKISSGDQPVHAARVELYREELGSQKTHALPGRAPDNFSGGTALSDDDGVYRIAGLVAGQYRLRVEREGFAPFERTIAVERARTEQNIELDAGADLDVIVYGEDLQPAAGKWVLAKSATFSGSARTDDRGIAKLRTLPRGKIIVSALVAGAPSREVRIGAAPSEPLELRVGSRRER